MADALVPLTIVKNPPKTPLWSPFSRRFHHILLLMFGFASCTFMRINLSITITCMVNSTAVTMGDQEKLDRTSLFLPTSAPSENSSYLQQVLPELEESSGGSCQKTSGKRVIMDYGGSLLWSHSIQNFLFSANFMGGMIVVMPSMFLIQRYSPRVLLLFSVLLYSISTASIPYVANNLPYHFTFISRFIMGLGDGLINPAANAVIANWFPVTERSTAVSLFTTGNQLAGAGGNPLAAFLCQSTWGWPSVFYMSALAGLVWCVLWWMTSADHPTLAKTISHAEKIYLEANCLKRKTTTKSSLTVPYRAMFTSIPFIAVLVAQMQVNFLITLFAVYLPSYFKDVLYLGVMSNGLYSSLPNIFSFVCKMVWSLVMDRLKEKNVITPTTAVKLSQCLASYGSAICLLLIAYLVDCSRPTLALVILCANFSFMSCFTSGMYTSLLSLAPRFTGTLSSVCLTFAIFARLITPSVVGLIKKTGSLQEWQTLFYTTAALGFLSGTIFLICGSGEIQEWGRDKSDSISKSRSKLDLSFSQKSLKIDEPEEFQEIVSVQRTRSESVCV